MIFQKEVEVFRKSKKALSLLPIVAYENTPRSRHFSNANKPHGKLDARNHDGKLLFSMIGTLFEVSSPQRVTKVKVYFGRSEYAISRYENKFGKEMANFVFSSFSIHLLLVQSNKLIEKFRRNCIENIDPTSLKPE